jgi:hypothetical protein
MNVFLALGSLVGALFVVHVVWWRIRLPRRQRAVLLMLLVVGGVLLAPGTAWLVHTAGLASLSWIQWTNVALGVLAFTLAYVVTYSALEADSPTLSLLRYISECGRCGVGNEELAAFMEKRPFVAARLSALIEEDMLIEEAGRYRLADHPYVLFRLVLFYREVILGMRDHGG